MTSYTIHDVTFNKKNLQTPKGVIKIRKQKKDRHFSGQKEKDKMTNNDLQNIT